MRGTRPHLRRIAPIAIAALVALWPPLRVEARPEVEFKKGVALAEIHPGHGAATFAAALEDIRGLGADWTLIPVFGFTDSAAAPGVDPDFESIGVAEYRRFVAGIIRDAHRRGLSVLLIPYVNLRTDNGTDWRGSLRPPDWDAWFLSYESFITGWADFCRKEKVEMMAVGAELISTESRTRAWRRIVATVRARYPGRLTYSCNWDHYRAVEFHDDLDVLGLSGYYSLPFDAPMTAEAVESNWREIRAELIQFSHQIDRRLLFTEIGYPAMRGAARDPWNYTIQGEPDPGEQARSLSAFFRVWAGTPELDGVFIWNYSPIRGGALDTSYSINGKPASAVVRSWFRHRTLPEASAGGR